MPKSGRRSDASPHYTVQRKELKYSAPPRGRGGGGLDHGGGFQGNMVWHIIIGPGSLPAPQEMTVASIAGHC